MQIACIGSSPATAAAKSHEPATSASSTRRAVRRRSSDSNRLDRAGCQALAHEHAHALMARVVHHVQHHPGDGQVGDRRAAVRPVAARLRREGDRIVDHRHALRVSVHRPEAFAVRCVLGRRVPPHRRGASELGERGVRKAVRELIEVGEIDAGEVHGLIVSSGSIASSGRIEPVAAFPPSMATINDFNRSLIEEFRTNDGKLSAATSRAPRLLLLTTTGAKTGRTHTTPIVYLRATGSSVFVFASKGGAPTTPGLVPQPRREPGGHRGATRRPIRCPRRRARGRGARSRLSTEQKANMPNFADYESKTTRLIPVIALERIA